MKKLTAGRVPVSVAQKNLAQITSIHYKKFFTVPKVKIIWQQGSWTGAKTGRTYGGLYFFINGKQLPGWCMFDYPFFFATLAETQQWCDSWMSQKITRVINSVQVGASQDKGLSKQILKQLYGVTCK